MVSPDQHRDKGPKNEHRTERDGRFHPETAQAHEHEKDGGKQEAGGEQAGHQQRYASEQAYPRGELQITEPEVAAQQSVGHEQERRGADSGGDAADETEVLVGEEWRPTGHEHDRRVDDERQRDPVGQDLLVEVSREQNEECGAERKQDEEAAATRGGPTAGGRTP